MIARKKGTGLSDKPIIKSQLKHFLQLCRETGRVFYFFATLKMNEKKKKDIQTSSVFLEDLGFVLTLSYSKMRNASKEYVSL